MKVIGYDAFLRTIFNSVASSKNSTFKIVLKALSVILWCTIGENQQFSNATTLVWSRLEVTRLTGPLRELELSYLSE